MPPKDTLGNRVRVARERLGITQVDLAREVGISRQALISVEKGRMNPSVVVSLKIARILREPVDYLFFIDGRDGEAPEPAERSVAKAAKKPKAAAPAPKPVAMPEPESVAEPEPESTPEPAADFESEPVYAEEVETQPIADEPHIVLDPEAAHETEPEVDEEPPEVIIVEAEEAPEPEAEPEPEPAPARHAVPVSAEPEAPTTGDKPRESGDEADDAQLSLFE